MVFLPGQVAGLGQQTQATRRQGVGLAGGFGRHGTQALHDHDELVTAPARQGVVLAQTGLQAGGHVLQQQVAHVMAQGVVECFEIVKVDEQQGALTLIARAAEESFA